MTTLTLLLVAFTASGDLETPKGSCSDFVEHYRELLRDRATSEVSDMGEPSRAVGAAQADAAKVFDAARPRIEEACRSTNRSGFECVAEAGSYGDLGACMVKGLPLLPDDRHVAEVRRQLDADAPELPRDPALIVEEFVATGEVELSPELTRAAFEEPAATAAEPARTGPSQRR